MCCCAAQWMACSHENDVEVPVSDPAGFGHTQPPLRYVKGRKGMKHRCLNAVTCSVAVCSSKQPPWRLLLSILTRGLPLFV